ncbi:MAG: alpha/beta hydrolase, partial [Planctomycetaceae bacterium]
MDAAPKTDAAARKAAATPDTTRGDKMLEAYFQAETSKVADGSLAEIRTKEDWAARREEYRRQLREMLSLDPMPEKGPLEAQVTGTLEQKDFIVEKVQFQSLPGLYVTGNLYRPKNIEGKLPAILYVCGHGGEKKDGISFGNKTHYRHHGAWYARNGYVCLAIDTIQLGEIEGVHHGTHKFDMWWWNARGYSPAGVEAWNGIRALDYLETRPEVDKEKLGVTGRSGGGAYSWWVAALDERI